MTISEKLQKHNFADISRGFQGHSISDKQKRPWGKDKAMQYTEKELLTNIKKSLVALLTDAEKRHEQTRIELPLSVEQARWAGRKVQELLEESEEEPLFTDNPWNYEYDLPKEDRRLPSPHDWFDDDFVRRWKREDCKDGEERGG